MYHFIYYFIYHFMYPADYAVCTVFGDPHYRTFDGAIYNFQGLCNYILARDCSRAEEFSIHVRNDARLTNDFAWTKSVTVRTGRIKVYLFRNFRVKINRYVYSSKSYQMYKNIKCHVIFLYQKTLYIV